MLGDGRHSSSVHVSRCDMVHLEGMCLWWRHVFVVEACVCGGGMYDTYTQNPPTHLDAVQPVLQLCVCVCVSTCVSTSACLCVRVCLCVFRIRVLCDTPPPASLQHRLRVLTT